MLFCIEENLKTNLASQISFDKESAVGLLKLKKKARKGKKDFKEE